MLGLHHSTNWEPFQLDNPEAAGYVAVEATRGISLEKKLTVKDACTFVHVIAAGEELPEGDEITITIGDTSKESSGSRAQMFAQPGFAFFTLVDADGYGSYFQDPCPPVVNIIGGRAEKIKVVVPSTVYPGELFDAYARVEDNYHNAARDYQPDFTIAINGERLDDAQIERINGNPAVICIKNVTLKHDGIFVIEVTDKNQIKGRSNCIRCTSDRSGYKVFWGDIHCHLGYMDSVGTVDRFYDYARNISFLDFVCHSEHMDSYSGGRQASNPIQWEIIKEGVKKYNEPGRFVTLLGYENSEIWDANVYFPGDSAPWHVDSFAERLFEFARRNQAIVIPHMTTYPQRLRGYDWSNYEEDVVPAIEIYSTHGSSEYFGGERPLANCEPGGYAVEALNRGYKLGFIGSGDGHDCMPGNAPGGRYMNGLIAVYAKELTREAVFDAIRNRRCYAATNARILGYFHINGHVGGSEFEVTDQEPVNIDVSFYGTDSIEKAELVKNGVIIYTTGGTGDKAEFKIKDVPGRKKHNYYYARMRQKDGEMAWLSPIFVKVNEKGEG